jgi:hypothetical protein
MNSHKLLYYGFLILIVLTFSYYQLDHKEKYKNINGITSHGAIDFYLWRINRAIHLSDREKNKFRKKIISLWKNKNYHALNNWFIRIDMLQTSSYHDYFNRKMMEDFEKYNQL